MHEFKFFLAALVNTNATADTFFEIGSLKSITWQCSRILCKDVTKMSTNKIVIRHSSPDHDVVTPNSTFVFTQV